jgi:RNase P subunit RPR2
MAFIGKLPKIIGRSEIITCPKCGKKHRVTYHGKAIEHDTYTHTCSCGEPLFTESDRDTYRVEEIS